MLNDGRKSGSCYACGGMVDDEGMAIGGEAPEMEEEVAVEPDNEDTHRAKFVAAILKRKETK